MAASHLIKAPRDYFKTPIDIVRSEVLNRKEKEAALINWKDLLIHKKESSYEGFGGFDSEEGLEQINNALRMLKK